MNSIIGIALFSLVLIGLIWISISRATEDGFFTSLWTVIVLFFAYQFTRCEWGAFYTFLTNSGMSKSQAISTAYWIALLIVIAPGMVAIKFLSRPKVPFPYLFESYGSTLLGACAGLLLFAALGHWILYLDFLSDSFTAPLQVFRPLFEILGYRTTGFE